MNQKTDYAGIDYGLGQTNVNHETGIRYGVIPVHHVGQAWYDESEAFYPDVCPMCGEEFEQVEVYPEHCDYCGNNLEESDFDFQEPTSFSFEDAEYSAEQSADDTDIFILKSPYFTYAQFCSPCAPGAGYLLNWTDPDVGVKAYCFGHDWFEAENAPYPVYSVETGELV